MTSIKVDIPNGYVKSRGIKVNLMFSSNPLGFLRTSSLTIFPENFEGIGEIDIAIFAANVHIFRFLLQNQNSKSINLGSLRFQLLPDIISGMKWLIPFYHPKTGGFSNLGEAYKDLENTCLTASVFQAFSEAAKLLLPVFPFVSLELQSYLSQSYDFLRGRQSADGCFFDVAASIEGESEAQLRLTAHVLSALQTASAEIKELKFASFEEIINASIKCVERLVELRSFQEISTYTLAHVAFALKDTAAPIRKQVLGVLERRVEPEGSLMWWKAFFTADKLPDLETTALAVLSE